MSAIRKIFALVVVLAMLLSACASPAAPTTAPEVPQEEPTQAPESEPSEPADGGDDTLNIAVVVKAVTSDYWKLVGAGVEAAMAADPSINATFLGPNEETDIEGQIRIIEAQISAQVDALAVAPSQADQLAPTLQAAVDAGIPVVLIDTNIETFEAKSAFVGTDNRLGGQLAGEYIAGQLQAGDEVVILRGAAGDPVHNLREEGAVEALEAAGIVVAAVQPANSDRAMGQSVAENLFTAHPNVKAVYATNDEMALGAYNAAQAAGLDLIIVGFDASPDALQAIQDGQLSASIAQFPGKIGELGTLTAAAVARGQSVESFVNTGVEVVTADNVAQFMSGAGEPAEEPAEPEAQEPLDIAVVVKAVTSDYWKLVGAGVEAAMAADPSINATFLGPNEETDIEGQIRIIEAQISAQVDALAVAPSQADQLAPTLQAAVDAGIPVVLIDTNIETFEAKSAFVGTDNRLGGQLAGEYIAGQLQAGDEVVILRGAAGDPVHNLREEGAVEALEAAGIVVAAVQPANSDRAMGQSVAENLFTAHPNVKAVYATNDEMALGAYNAAQAAGLDLIIVGFDASPDALQAIQDGQLSASIAQFPGKIGELGTLTAAAVARGQSVESFVNTGVEVVTADNVAEFMQQQ